MKSLLSAVVLVTFSASAAAAGCGWMKQQAVADAETKSDKQTVMQSTPSDAGRSTEAETAATKTERTDDRMQVAVQPTADDAANN
jgi:hypothetical protein